MAHQVPPAARFRRDAFNLRLAVGELLRWTTLRNCSYEYYHAWRQWNCIKPLLASEAIM